MRIHARRIKRCAYPPIGKYVSNGPFEGSFEDLELKSFKVFPQLRPDGVRQPTVEATILGKLVAKAQGRAGFPDADVESGRA